MKHFLRAFCLLLAILLLAPMLLSCSLVKSFFDDGEDLYGGYAGELVKDAYGFDRPATCWLTECLLLSEQPPLTELFGTAGESGLANEKFLQNDGKIVLNEKNYLVCLYYGSLPYSDTPISSYLDFTVVNGTEILHGSDCVENVWVKSWNGDLEDPSVMYMFAAPEKRLTFQNPYKNVIQGAVVIEFTPKIEGTLVAECILQVEGVWEDAENNPYCVDYSDLVQTNASSAADYAYGEYIFTEYLTESVYNHGDYAEEDVSYVASFDNGQNCYMVLDYCITATKDGYGGRPLEILVFVQKRGELDLRLEEAPTNDFKAITTKDGFGFCMTFQMPNAAGEQKTGKIVMRLTPISGGTANVCALLLGEGNVALEGNTYYRTEIAVGEGAVKYALDESGEFYTVRSSTQRSTYIEIFDELGGGVPVIAIDDSAFADNKTLEMVTIGKNIKTIGRYAFYNCTHLTTLIYTGTMAEWEQVTKTAGWKVGTKLTKVVCSDGDVEL